MGTINSACENCLGQKPRAFQPSPTTNKHHENFQTCESTIEDLDRADSDAQQLNASSLADLEAIKNKKRQKYQRLSLEDFNMIKVIGQGSFGKIYLVQKKANKKFYALKTMKKKDLVLKNLLKCVLNEKNILREIEHPFVVRLRCSFQTNTRVYMVMEYCIGGDLESRLKKEGRFTEKNVKFYAAELVLALEYLHDKLNIIHRDLKPENVLIAADGHLKIADFGLAKTSTRALTLCGTPDYLAPEVMWGKSYGQAVDWWGLGCLIYQMLTGLPPFSQKNRDKLIADIMTANPVMPPWFSSSLKSLLLKLMAKNPKQRLGANGASEVKNHPFFKGIDWRAMLNKEISPPLKVASLHLETPMRSKSAEEGSSLEFMAESGSQDNYHIEFPRFSFAAKDTLIDDSYIKDEKE